MAKKTTQKKPGKKAEAKAPAVSNGAAELKEFRAAIQNLKAAGSALAKAVRANRKLGSSAGVRSALDRAQNAAAAIAKSIPVDPPGTTIFQ